MLASGTTFPSGTAEGFLRDGTVIGNATGLPEGAKSAVASLARNFNRVLHAFGTESAKADFFGHPFSHPLAEPYYSQAPIRFGDHVAKLGAFPVSPAQDALKDWRLDPKEDEDGFRHATVDHFRTNEVVFELRAQLWRDADSQPIEDASVEWSEDLSPFVTVARIRLPAQDAYSAARQRYFDEAMTFRPAHSLAAHRPLGSVMRLGSKSTRRCPSSGTARTASRKRTRRRLRRSLPDSKGHIVLAPPLCWDGVATGARRPATSSPIQEPA